MSHVLSRAAHRWVGDYDDLMGDVTVTILEGGAVASRRTGISHHMADAAEISYNGEATIAARWLCGGSSVDAVLLPETDIACLNCRMAAQMPQRPCVYFAWDENEDLLYVGSSVNVVQRVRGHMSTTRWWSEVKRLTFAEYDTEFEIRRAEFESIAERPGKYNRDGVIKSTRVSPLGFIVGGAQA